MHDGSNNGFVRGRRFVGLLEQIQGQETVLFKENKSSAKEPQAGGFDAHTNAPAYQHAGILQHMTINLDVDGATQENGCREGIPMELEWEDAHSSEPFPLDVGDVLIFGSFLAHRSGPNRPTKPRAAVYATYNALSDVGDRHVAYYAASSKAWPPTSERVAGESYAEGARAYGFGSPMAGATMHSRSQTEMMLKGVIVGSSSALPSMLAWGQARLVKRMSEPLANSIH